MEDLSSQVEAENRKYGHKNGIKTIPIITQDQNSDYFNKFLEWLEDNIQELARLHLLGGETYLQHDLMSKVFDIIERKPNPSLQLNIFSNFNAPKKLWYDYNNRIKDYAQAGNIGRFDLTCSIDCWGPQAEYVRHGLDLTILEEYLAWAADQSEDWLYLNVNQTISSMTIKTMPELIEKINQYNQHRHIGHYFQFYTGRHMFQHPNIFAYSHWAKDFENIFKSMPTETVDQQEAVQRMTGMQQYLKSFTKHQYNMINQLHVYLDELDRRRNTNWRALFSYLDIRQ
jgi:hypothetical protein